MTVLASQPSVSIETLTTQRTCSPSLPLLPTVFITSRSSSSSVIFSTSAPGLRRRYSGLKAAISAAATCLKSAFIPSPDSSCAESMRIVRGRASGLPSTTLLSSCEVARLVRDDLAVHLDLLARDPVIDELADDGVGADDDEHRRRLAVLRELRLPVR